MIPKRIIWGWFGNKPLPKIFEVCKASWEKHCPGWEWLKLDETTFDVEMCNFSLKAYRSCNYSYVNDVARVWALHEYGGVYFDTDFYLLRRLGEFMHAKAFIGIDDRYKAFSTGIIGSEKGGQTAGAKLERYRQLKFYNLRSWLLGTYDYRDVLNVPEIANKMRVTNETVRLQDIDVYPPDYFTVFTPYPPYTAEGERSERTAGAHLFDGSWIRDGGPSLAHERLRKLL